MPSLGFEELDLLLQIARDSALGFGFHERLDAITEALRALVPSTCLSVLVVPAPSTAAAPRLLFKDNSVENLLAYAEHYRHADPMGHLIAQPTGETRSLSEFVSERDYGRDAFTGEFLPSSGLRHVLGLARALPGGRTLALALQREPGLGDFTTKERMLLDLAGPDLARAAVGSLLNEELVARLAASDEALRSGVLVFTAGGALAHADAAARALCGRLLDPPFPSAALREDVGQLLEAGAAEGATIERTLEADGDAPDGPRAGGRRIQARSSRLAGPEPRVLTVLELIEPLAGAIDELARRCGLTERERDAAALAIDGLGNRHIGYKLGISAVTVGVHLSRVYRKTGVAGRTELTRLLAGGPQA